MTDIFSVEKRSEVMRAIKSKNTGIEKILFSIAKGFWSVCRYRLHFRIYGVRPDLWFPKAKLAIFADGDFWHGKDFENQKNKLQPYWKEKIAKNIDRDRRQDSILEFHGIRVLRFWGSDILKDPETVKEIIGKEIGDEYGSQISELTTP